MDDDPHHNQNESQDRKCMGTKIEVNRCKTLCGDIRDELVVESTSIKPSDTDYKSLSKYFLNANEDVIKRTFQATTQFARSGWIMGDIHKTYKAPFPAMNVLRRNEPVATDAVFADTLSYD